MLFKKRIILSITLLAAVPVLFGQELAAKHSLDASWGVTVPVGEGNFLNNPTYTAPFISYQYSVTPTLSVGASIGYSYGSEKGMTRDRFDEDIIDAFSTRDLSTTTLMAEVRFSPWNRRYLMFQPYISVAGGTSYARFSITGDAIQRTKISNWAEAYAVKIGARYAFNNEKSYIDAAIGWRHQGNDIKKMHIESQQGLAISVGYGITF